MKAIEEQILCIRHNKHLQLKKSDAGMKSFKLIGYRESYLLIGSCQDKITIGDIVWIGSPCIGINH